MSENVISREVTTARGVTYKVTGLRQGKTVRTSVEKLISRNNIRSQWRWVYGIPSTCSITEAAIRAELEE